MLVGILKASREVWKEKEKKKPYGITHPTAHDSPEMAGAGTRGAVVVGILFPWFLIRCFLEKAGSFHYLYGHHHNLSLSWSSSAAKKRVLVYLFSSLGFYFSSSFLLQHLSDCFPLLGKVLAAA